jgi:hypothetical protein
MLTGGSVGKNFLAELRHNSPPFPIQPVSKLIKTAVNKVKINIAV